MQNHEKTVCSIGFLPHANLDTRNVSASILSPEELKRFQNIQLNERQIKFLAGRHIVKTIIADIIDEPASNVVLLSDEKGSPRHLHKSPLSFSISHTQGLTVAAVSSHTLGIDIEYRKHGRAFSAITKSYFHPEEDKFISSISNQPHKLHAFYRFWTVKEAWIKAQGLSIWELGTVPQSIPKTGTSAHAWWFELPGDYTVAVFSSLELQIDDIKVIPEFSYPSGAQGESSLHELQNGAFDFVYLTGGRT